MTFKAHIDRAGRFPVAQAIVPHFTRPVQLDLPRCGILHTTEGPWDPSMGVFRVHFAPHFMLGYDDRDKKVEIIQMVPVGIMGAATKAHDDMAIVQIEMVEHCKDHLWLPDNPETTEALAALMVVCEQEWGIPLSHPWKDGDFGLAGSSARNKHRSAGLFGTVPGWYGHGDMPDPDTHWDPGALAWSKVFLKANELKAAPVASAA